MNSKNKSSALCPKVSPSNGTCYPQRVRHIVFRDVKPSIKTATVEVNEWQAWLLLKGAREHLGRTVAEYDGREAFQFLIDEAKADVAKWQAVSDSFDK